MFSALDYKKELELEQKRQQLQRELSQLAEEEVENVVIPKKVGCPISVSAVISVSLEEVPLVEFMYPVFTRMPGGVTAGDSGLCCCVPCLLRAVLDLPFVDSINLSFPVCQLSSLSVKLLSVNQPLCMSVSRCLCQP